jgi:hypothetical protein
MVFISRHVEIYCNIFRTAQSPNILLFDLCDFISVLDQEITDSFKSTWQHENEHNAQENTTNFCHPFLGFAGEKSCVMYLNYSYSHFQFT